MSEPSIPNIAVVIPARNEEESIAKVIGDLPPDLAGQIIVVNNGSSDRTSEMAVRAGALVLDEPDKGYGNACLRAIEYLNGLQVWPEILVFLDGDYSDHPEQINRLIDPIVRDNYDLVLGSRVMGNDEAGSMTWPQRTGNLVATVLIRMFYRFSYTDLGPFRAIKFNRLMELGMSDRNYGWTIEMQLKALKSGLRCTEVPVDYRKRIGLSKVSGTWKGSIMAGFKIIFTIFRHL